MRNKLEQIQRYDLLFACYGYVFWPRNANRNVETLFLENENLFLKKRGFNVMICRVRSGHNFCDTKLRSSGQIITLSSVKKEKYRFSLLGVRLGRRGFPHTNFSEESALHF